MQISVPNEVPLQWFSLSLSFSFSCILSFSPFYPDSFSPSEWWKRMGFVTVGGHGYLRAVENSSWINTGGQRADVRLLYYTRAASATPVASGSFLDRGEGGRSSKEKDFLLFCVVHGPTLKSPSTAAASLLPGRCRLPAESISRYNEIPAER